MTMCSVQDTKQWRDWVGSGLQTVSPFWFSVPEKGCFSRVDTVCVCKSQKTQCVYTNMQTNQHISLSPPSTVNSQHPTRIFVGVANNVGPRNNFYSKSCLHAAFVATALIAFQISRPVAFNPLLGRCLTSSSAFCQRFMQFSSDLWICTYTNLNLYLYLY